MYKVIKFFTDLYDDGYPYEEGDIYPRNGYEVSKARIKELSGNRNRQKQPLIKEVAEEETPKAAEKQPPKKGTKKAKAQSEETEQS